MNTRELYLHSRSAQLLLDVWDSYAERIGPQQSRLRPKGRLIFDLIGQTVAAGFTPFLSPLRLVMKQNPGGFFLFFGGYWLPQDSGRTVYGLTAGMYRLRISHEAGFYQTAIQEVQVPRPAVPYYPIALEPGATYPYVPTSTGVRGRVIDPTRPADDNGVAGVRVTVGGFPCSALSDRDGGWVYYLPETDPTEDQPNRVQVTLRHPDDNRQGSISVSIRARQMNPAGEFQF